MIGLDTNVLVRYLVQDDPDQSAAASALIEELTETDPGYLSLLTVVELYWVLRRAYTVDVDRCAELLEGLLDARELRVAKTRSYERRSPPTAVALTSRMRSSLNSAKPPAATTRLLSTSARRETVPCNSFDPGTNPTRDGTPDADPPAGLRAQWPESEHPQQFHLDVMVKDLASAEIRVLALGARSLPAGDHVYVDPSGAPILSDHSPNMGPPDPDRWPLLHVSCA